MTNEQFKNGLAWVSAKSAGGYEGCHWMLSAGSSLLIYSVIINKGVSEGYSLYLLVPIALAAGAIWYNAIEHTLKVVLPFAVAFICSSKSDRKALTSQQRRSGWMSVITSLVLLTATGSLSLFINPQISKMVNSEEDSSAEIAQTEAVRSSYDRDVELLSTQLEQARKDDAKAIQEAKTAAARWIAQAEGSKGRKMRDLLHNGNEWAAGQLKSSIAKAKAKGDRHVKNAIESAKAPTLQSQLTEYMKTSGAARDAVAVSTADLIRSRREAYEIDLTGMTNTLFWGVLFVIILFVFLCFLMVNARLSRGEDIVDDDSPGIFTVAKSALITLNKRLGEKYADKWNVKFVSAPPAPTLAYADNSPSMTTEKSAENSQPRTFQQKSASKVSVKSQQRSASENVKSDVKVSKEDKSESEVTAPPPGLAIPKKVSAGFWVDDATINYRKRVYNWWSTAHNKKKLASTRESNKAKAEKAFAWFASQGCTVTIKTAGKVSIKFPKG